MYIHGQAGGQREKNKMLLIKFYRKVNDCCVILMEHVCEEFCIIFN